MGSERLTSSELREHSLAVEFSAPTRETRVRILVLLPIERKSMKRIIGDPTEVFAVMVKSDEGWRVGPAMYGLDTITDIVAGHFMCRENAERMATEMAQVRIPGSTKVVRFIRDVDYEFKPVRKSKKGKG